MLKCRIALIISLLVVFLWIWTLTIYCQFSKNWDQNFGKTATVQPYAKAKLWIRFVLQGWDALHVNCLLCSPHARILQLSQTHYEVAFEILRFFFSLSETFQFSFLSTFKIGEISRKIVGWNDFRRIYFFTSLHVFHFLFLLKLKMDVISREIVG